jgi:hypothetical protein
LFRLVRAPVWLLLPPLCFAWAWVARSALFRVCASRFPASFPPPSFVSPLRLFVTNRIFCQGLHTLVTLLRDLCTDCITGYWNHSVAGRHLEFIMASSKEDYLSRCASSAPRKYSHILFGPLRVQQFTFHRTSIMCLWTMVDTGASIMASAGRRLGIPSFVRCGVQMLIYLCIWAPEATRCACRCARPRYLFNFEPLSALPPDGRPQL